jgi:hypothetical protein
MRLFFICIFVLVSGLVYSAENHFFKKGTLVISEDNEFYFRFNPEELMTQKALEDYVDNLRYGKVSHFFMGVNGQRTNYRTKVSEAVWDKLKNDKIFPEIQWTKCARLLYERGLDPYAIWTKKCREIGVSPWIEMRINDTHFLTRANEYKDRARILDFWRDHPEYRRTKKNPLKTWKDGAFDFSHKQVRDYKLALVREFLENWDCDGISIDWLRAPFCLTEGKEKELSHCLTEFMSEVRKLTDEFSKKRGRKIGVAVRVPFTIELSRGLGINVDDWAKMGLVDAIIISQSYQTYFDINFDSWKKALGEKVESRVALLGACDHGFNPYPCFKMKDSPRARRVKMEMPYCRAWADNTLSNGADGLYAYNMMYTRHVWFELAKEGLEKSEIIKKHRRYPVSYMDNDILFENFKDITENMEVQLPVEVDAEKFSEIKIKVATPSQKGKAVVVVGFEKGKGMENSKFSATLNDVEYEKVRTEFMPFQYGKSEYALRFEFSANVLKRGVNSFKIKGTSAKIVYAEIQVD